MSEDQPVVHVSWYRQKVVLFITGSIIVALLLVIVSMALYASSGAAQLDLSRPGYKSVQSQLDQSENFEGYPASGPVNKQVIEDFNKTYQKQTRSVDNTEVFSGSALDAQSLGIDAPSADE